jgi:hypothetical protein
MHPDFFRAALALAHHTHHAVVRHLLDSVGVKGPVTPKEGEAILIIGIILAVLVVVSFLARSTRRG